MYKYACGASALPPRYPLKPKGHNKKRRKKKK
jgi:hypothetical protein